MEGEYHMAGVVGYVDDGAIYCKYHCPCSDAAVVTTWDEFDAPQHCDVCHEFLHNNITYEGIKYMENLYFSGMRNEGLWREYMEEYPWIDWYFIHTWVGPMNPLGEIIASID
jgi:hypothetical protein